MSGSGTPRGFKQFSWLEVDSVKAVSSRPAWLSTGEAVSRHTGTPKGYNASY